MYRIFFIVLVFAGFVSFVVAGEDPNVKGAEKLELNGGFKGKVPFPHHQHQKISDCTKCHSIFPKEAGVIDKKKADGSLKKKQVMNKLCIKCHKAEKNAGKPYGPISCSKCHTK